MTSSELTNDKLISCLMTGDRRPATDTLTTDKLTTDD